MAVFFIQAAAGGGMFARIPDFQVALGISEGVLGLVLLGQPVGALLTFLVAGRAIDRIGTRPLLLAAIPAIALSVGAMALAPAAAVLASAFFAYGVSFAISNVAMNVEADRVEAAFGRRILNTCHGLWALGFLAAALVATAMRGSGVDQATHLWLMVPPVLIAALAVLMPLRPSPPRAHGTAARRKVLTVPTAQTLLLVGFGLAGVLIEVATRHWSVIFMRDSFSAPAWLETFALPAFLATMALGRLFADGWTERFGAPKIAAVATLISLGGVACVVFSPALWVALTGFGLMGLGVCVSFPLMLSAAARLGDRPAAENVAAVTMVMTIINLGTPAAMGLTAELYGIRASFALILPFGILALMLVGRLAPPPGGG